MGKATFFLSKKYVLFLFLIIASTQSIFGQDDLDKLLDSLEATIERAPGFIQQKENTIQALMRQSNSTGISADVRFRFQSELLDAYRQYRFDSALKYVNNRTEIARNSQNLDWLAASALQLSEVLISAGMYLEAFSQLESINPSRLSPELLNTYYHDRKLSYEALRDYAQDFKYAPSYALKAREYQDSLLSILPTASVEYRVEKAIQLMGEGKLDGAEKLLLDIFRKDLIPGTAPYAGITAVMADLYRMKGNAIEERRYRIYSAIADIQAVVKENKSLTDLAVSLYEEGEIERANAFIAYAMADANFYNARQRKIEIAKIYPIITKAYQIESKRQESRLKTFFG